MKNAQDSNQSTDLIVTDTVPAKPSSATDLVQNKTNGELVVDGKNKQQLTQVRLLYAYFLEVWAHFDLINVMREESKND